MRQLVETYPTTIVLFVGTALAVAVCLVALYWVRSRWPGLSKGSHNDATNGILTVGGTLYAIVLGFVILDAYGGIADANAAVSAEASQLAQLLDDTEGLPGLEERVAGDIAGYVNHVVNVEWPAMRSGNQPTEREPNFVDLFAAFRAFTPADEPQRVFYAEAVGRLNKVVEARRTRIAAAEHEMPDALRSLLVGGAIVIMILTLALGVENRRVHMVIVGGFAALLAFTVLLALVLDFPFSGDFRVTDEPFRIGALSGLGAIESG